MPAARRSDHLTPEAGTIETGWLTFAPRLQRTREAIEAVYLLMRRSFGAGYRRFEWKCDAANAASRRGRGGGLPT